MPRPEPLPPLPLPPGWFLARVDAWITPPAPAHLPRTSKVRRCRVHDRNAPELGVVPSREIWYPVPLGPLAPQSHRRGPVRTLVHLDRGREQVFHLVVMGHQQNLPETALQGGEGGKHTLAPLPVKRSKHLVQDQQPQLTAARSDRLARSFSEPE